jgi:hypothetical protein
VGLPFKPGGGIVDRLRLAANAGNHFGGDDEAARISARAHHESDEAGAWYPTGFGEPIDVQSVPVTNSCEMGLYYVRSQVL